MNKKERNWIIVSPEKNTIEGRKARIREINLHIGDIVTYYLAGNRHYAIEKCEVLDFTPGFMVQIRPPEPDIDRTVSPHSLSK